MSETLRHFFRVVAGAGRLNLLPDLRRTFDDLVDEREGIDDLRDERRDLHHTHGTSFTAFQHTF